MPTVTNRVQVLGEDPGACLRVLCRIDDRFPGCDWRSLMNINTKEPEHVITFEVEVGEKLSEYFQFLSKQNEEVTLIHDYCGETIGEHAGRRIWHVGEKTVPSQCDESGYFREGTVLAHLHWIWLQAHQDDQWYVNIDARGKARYMLASEYWSAESTPFDDYSPLNKLCKLYRRHLRAFPLSDIPAFQLPQPKD